MLELLTNDGAAGAIFLTNVEHFEQFNEWWRRRENQDFEGRREWKNTNYDWSKTETMFSQVR